MSLRPDGPESLKSPASPEVVTFHLWGVRGRQVPWALSRMALHRQLVSGAGRKAAGVPGLRFAKLLGTGHGTTFTPTDADPRHWALVASWDSAAAAAAFESGRLVSEWDAHSAERWRLLLRPLSSTGRWSGSQPFGPPGAAPPEGGLCAILTRARLVPHKMATFWRSVPPVARILPHAAGLRFARGIGEAPVGLQATFSVWDNLDAAKAFAYHSPAHRRVIERTAETGWYAEQLFARFAVTAARGMVDGRDPLGEGSGSRESVG